MTHVHVRVVERVTRQNGINPAQLCHNFGGESHSVQFLHDRSEKHVVHILASNTVILPHTIVMGEGLSFAGGREGAKRMKLGTHSLVLLLFPPASSRTEAGGGCTGVFLRPPGSSQLFTTTVLPSTGARLVPMPTRHTSTPTSCTHTRPCNRPITGPCLPSAAHYRGCFPQRSVSGSLLSHETLPPFANRQLPSAAGVAFGRTVRAFHQSRCPDPYEPDATSSHNDATTKDHIYVFVVIIV